MSNLRKNEATKSKTTERRVGQLRDKRSALANDNGAKESRQKKILEATDQKCKTVTSFLPSDKHESSLSKLEGMSRISSDSTIKKISKNKVNHLRLGRREEERAGSVTKTKYFPSQKDIIHRVVREEKMKKGINNQLSKANNTKPDVYLKIDGKEMERPRTATLKEATVTQLTINLPREEVKASKEEQVNYEDDFDSYISDFEDEDEEEEKTDSNTSKSTSSISESMRNLIENGSNMAGEDCNNDAIDALRRTNYISKERKLDSGSFDLQEKIVKTNNTIAIQEILSHLPPSNSSLSDEGYDEDKTVLKKLHGYRFEKSRFEEQRRLMYKKHRGKEIQAMIKFNKCYFTTFEMTPVPYEQFIQIHGQTFGIQCAIQTVATSNVDESVQTDEIVNITKWTHIPVVFSTKQFSEQQRPNWEHYKQEFLGVGNDSKVEQIQAETSYYLSDKFVNSINSSAVIVLSLLNNETNKLFYRHPKKTYSITNENEFFSAGSTKKCAQDLDILHNTSVIDLYTSNSNNFLTVHLPNNKKFTELSYICIWNASSLQQPLALLRILGRPTCASFGHEHINYVFVGFRDGTLSLWDTNNGSPNEKYRCISSPSFKTKINESHKATVTSVLCVSNNDSEKDHLEEKVHSLDEDGLVVFWTTVTKKYPKWNVSLVQNSQLRLKTVCSNPYYGLEFKRLYFNLLDPTHLFILSNSDRILHCCSTGSKIYPKYYNTDELSVVTSIDCCPFSSTYFIAGYENGKVALFSRNVQKSLIILSNGGNGKWASIDTVQWSSEKPCIFYAKDNKNILHVWNLALSDIFPIYSIPFKENVVSIKITTPQKRQKIYMIIASRDGQLSVHFLNNEHKSLTNEQYATDVKYFLNYVKRL
ncbi:WD repeat-containing protein 60 isoform X2 [Agrilus planipennis]|uniref:WD repeat-containing protein 60 isoform X2 n=1 Tax=Agrilus planipennis TaxID=224129 RepID=A0A1W4WWK2_AGRPL|nr:WD repeat-containing protein 60 isoform X2 [Agrilus planipennis]